MADNKTYYYMKINKDFFDDDTVKYLEEQEHGKDFIILYLKLCLKSLEDEGLLIRYVGTKLIPYDTAAIAKMTNIDIEIVEAAMKIFEEIELIEKKETGELFLSQIQEMIGTDTYEARKKRKQRARNKTLGDNVPKVSPASPPNVPEYKSKSIELKKDINKESEVDKLSQAATADKKSNFNIFDYYQQRIGMIDGYQYQKLKDYLDYDHFEEELIKIAIDRAADNGKRNFGYVNAILKNWAQNGITTVVQQNEEQRNFEGRKVEREQQQQPNQQEADNEPFDPFPDVPF